MSTFHDWIEKQKARIFYFENAICQVLVSRFISQGFFSLDEENCNTFFVNLVLWELAIYLSAF